jgi:hypothetical protein
MTAASTPGRFTVAAFRRSDGNGDRWVLARERTASSYGRQPRITTLSGDLSVILCERVISGALVDGFP